MKTASPTLLQKRKYYDPQRKNCNCIQEQQAPEAHQHTAFHVKTKDEFALVRESSFISWETVRLETVRLESAQHTEMDPFWQ